MKLLIGLFLVFMPLASFGQAAFTKHLVGGVASMRSKAGSTVAIELLAASAIRKAYSLVNDSGSSVYVLKGTAGSSVSYWIQLGPFGVYHSALPVYKGPVWGVWNSAIGSMRVTEETER